VLKYLPGDKAKDARSFMMSLQYWLGGSPENIEALLLNLASNYVAPIVAQGKLTSQELIAPEVIPDKGIWHPVAPRVFDTLDEYMTWLRTEHAPSLGIDVETAPMVGVVLQKSHINTRDDAHYVSLIMEMEAKGALVVPTYTGSLDFSICIDSYFFNAAGKVTRQLLTQLAAPRPPPAHPLPLPNHDLTLTPTLSSTPPLPPPLNPNRDPALTRPPST
jgi:magnesium chelatase subunit H